MTDYDVIVAGGGPAGIAAAVESARNGAKTLLIERYGALGGNLTLGLVGPFMGAVSKGTMADELLELLGSEYPKATCFDPEEAKLRLAEFVHASSAKVLLQANVSGASVQNGRIQEVEVCTKSGKMHLSAPIFIDATGDGDLSVLAGARAMMGREQDGLMQPLSHMFIIGGIDPDQHLVCHHEKHETIFPDGRSYLQLCKDACRRGELPRNVNIVRLYETGREGERMVNATQLNAVSGVDAASLFEADLELRRQIQTCCEFLRRNVPGFAHIFLRATPATVGVRETRRIEGERVLTAEDLAYGRKFPDVAVHNACFCVDIHNPSGAGQAEADRPWTVHPYDIPFSCMRPKGLLNLFTCGRCISGSHEAHASYRVMLICMALGQAAGAAAAMAAKTGCDTKDTDYTAVQMRLQSEGAVLFD